MKEAEILSTVYQLQAQLPSVPDNWANVGSPHAEASQAWNSIPNLRWSKKDLKRTPFRVVCVQVVQSTVIEANRYEI